MSGDNAVCTDCHETCLSCSGGTESKCTACPDDLIMWDDSRSSAIECWTECVPGTNYDEELNMCVDCADG